MRVRLLRAVAIAVLALAVAACSSPPPTAYWSDGGEGGGGPVVSSSPSAAPTGPSGANPYLAKVPKFGPPPVPQPITVPAGPLAAIYHRLPVNQPVAFLTMDDGFTQLPEGIELMRAARIRFTMFLIAPIATKSPAFFKQLEAAGGVIEDHTIDHPELKGKSYAYQHHEICDARTAEENGFGIHETLFRPPFGDYDQTTLRAVHDCGLKAAFHWSETVNNGVVYYQTANHHIQAGDIILMHFRPAFVADVLAALTAIHDAGLTPALLEDYIA
jgi:peptidoglycan/xylan/chitin deacetylase (PgdA/CDA1 family)